MFSKKKPDEKAVEIEIGKTSEEIKKPLELKSNFSMTLPNILSCEHFQYEIKKHCGRLTRFNRMFMSDDQNPPNCEELNELLYSCRKYVSDPERNIDCLNQLMDYENKVIRRRIDSIKANDVWKLRQYPPNDWNSPLPDWAAIRIKDSLWYKTKNESGN